MRKDHIHQLEILIYQVQILCTTDSFVFIQYQSEHSSRSWNGDLSPPIMPTVEASLSTYVHGSISSKTQHVFVEPPVSKYHANRGVRW